MDLDFESEKFKQLLTDNEEKIKSHSNEIVKTNEFKRLYSFLDSFVHENINKDFIVLLFEKQSIKKIPNECTSILKLIKEESTLYNFIYINSNLKVSRHVKRELPKQSNDSRRCLTSLSGSTKVVFLLSPDGINYFINKEDFGDGIFYSLDSLKSYKERRTIDNIEDLFDNFRKLLRERSVYESFFVSKSHLLSLKKDLDNKLTDKIFVKQYKHLLNNRPEDRFRECLRKYLKDNLRVNLINKEFMLETLKRLDIVMYDESGNNIFFIEVKWVGQSIKSDGKSFGLSFSEKDIVPDAYIQTTNYLMDLNNDNQNVKKGFLVVFDARKDDLADTGVSFEEDKLPPKNLKHLYKFKKIDDFRVKNDLPA